MCQEIVEAKGEKEIRIKRQKEAGIGKGGQGCVPVYLFSLLHFHPAVPPKLHY